jgi:single-strand DNA-binding protein
VYGPSGENVAKYVYKGRPVAVDGRLDWREWETKDGRNAQAVSIVAKSVQFLGSPSDNHNGATDDNAVVALESITGSEEEALDLEDQDAIAAVAA